MVPEAALLLSDHPAEFVLRFVKASLNWTRVNESKLDDQFGNEPNLFP
jgi:hypothetical protein